MLPIITYNPPPNSAAYHFDHFHKSGDTANAVAAWDFVMMAEYRKNIADSPSLNKKLPAIISAFQPKSGGTFLHNRMRQAGYQEFWWAMPHLQDQATVYALPNALKVFLEGGCSAHSHFLPHPYTLSVFERLGVTKVWVHLRDPAETVVAAFHHYAGDGHGEGDVGDARAQIAIEERKLWNLPSTINEFVQQELAKVVVWPAAWLALAEQQPDTVHFTSYKDIADPQCLIDGVMREFGYDGERLDFSNAVPVVDRVRRKKNTDWRAELSEKSVLFVRDYVDSQLGKYPFYESFRSDNI